MSMNIREFLKKFNINMVLTFTLIGVFLGVDFGYAHDVLRVPISFQSKKRARITRAMQALSDRRFIIQHEEFLRYLSPQQQIVLRRLYLSEEGTTQVKIAGQLEATVPSHTATGNGEIGHDEFHEGVTRQDVFGLKTSGLKKLRELADPDSDFQLVVMSQKKGLLSRLPAIKEQVLLLFFIDGMHQSEIAQLLGMSMSRVAYHSTSGIQMLRQLVDPNSDFQLVRRHKDLLTQPQFTKRQIDVLTHLYLGATRETQSEIVTSLHVNASAVSIDKTRGIEKLRELAGAMKRSTDL